MGKIIPFKQKQSFEEKAFRKKLQTNPDNLEIWGKLLILKIQEGKFSPESDYAKAILRCIETVDAEQINRVLSAIGSIIEAMHWSIFGISDAVNELFSQTTRHWGKVKELRISEKKLKEIRNDIYSNLFTEDKFSDDIRKLIPVSESTKLSVLGKTDSSSPELLEFFIKYIKKIISKHGLIDQLVYTIVFSSCPVLNEIPTTEINNLLSKRNFKAPKKDKSYKILSSITENYLTSRFKNNDLNFLDLYRLFVLRYILGKSYSNICNTILNAVSEVEADEVIEAVKTTNIPGGVEYGPLLYGDEVISYKSKFTGENSDFVKDLYIKLHDKSVFNGELAHSAFLFFVRGLEDLERCPVNYLILGALHEIDSDHPFELFYALLALYHAGVKLFDKRRYKESLICFKTSLFNALFVHLPRELYPIEYIDLEHFIQTTRKLNSYEDSINFLSKFKLLHEHGLPIHQGFLNEIESTRTELENEYQARTYHKIDSFYELVAKEDFPAIQSHVTGSKGQSKFLLTRDQLQILINKIQEKSDIIRGIKSISAKCDMLMYMHREIYDKQLAIFEVIKENHGSIEDLITQNTEKIIENIHERNKTFESQVNIKTVQDYYHGAIGMRLWKSLDEGTRTFLMLARHLDTTNQFSPSDEFGFVAIEYAKAVENEFKKKIIDGCLSTGCQIKYKAQDKVRLIVCDTRITLGEICTLIDKAKKAKDGDNLLWHFSQFIKNNTQGKQKLLDFKNELLQIKDKYRNPAAHPANYPRERLESFKGLLFEKGFLKDYLSCMQV